jgi:lipopolysaccharide transport system permease protein
MIENIKEIWKFRALVWALVCKHLSTRYRGSALGFLWSFLNPLFLLGVYALVFKYYIRFDDVQNYTVFMFAGLLPWIWFSGGLLEATSSISGGGSLITKAMFPPQILPVVAVITNLFNFLFALPLLFVFMLILDVNMTANLLLLPVVILVELVFLTGLSLAASALNVYYRDVQHILGNVMTLWFFLCPIIYPAKNVPEKFQFTLLLNPVAIMTQMYHAVIIEGVIPEPKYWLISLTVSVFTFYLGNLIFNRYREGFAELI